MLERRGERVKDLTLIVVTIGVMTCPSPVGRGHGDDFFSGLMGGLTFQVGVLVDDGLGFSPVGETGEGAPFSVLMCGWILGAFDRSPGGILWKTKRDSQC
jgi:hypothetical protein